MSAGRKRPPLEGPAEPAGEPAGDGVSRAHFELLRDLLRERYKRLVDELAPLDDFPLRGLAALGRYGDDVDGLFNLSGDLTALPAREGATKH